MGIAVRIRHKYRKKITSRDNNRNIRDTQYRKEIVTQLGVRMIILTVETRAEASNLLLLIHGEFDIDSDKLGSIGRAVSLALSEFVKFLSSYCFSIWVVKYYLNSIDKLFIGLQLDYTSD